MRFLVNNISTSTFPWPYRGSVTCVLYRYRTICNWQVLGLCCYCYLSFCLKIKKFYKKSFLKTLSHILQNKSFIYLMLVKRAKTSNWHIIYLNKFLQIILYVFQELNYYHTFPCINFADFENKNRFHMTSFECKM